jgi:DNA-binding NtrC family response regulator
MVWYEHSLPEASLDAEIVLHVRSVVRRHARTGIASMHDMGLYFGMNTEERATFANATSRSLDVVGTKLGELRGAAIINLPSDPEYTRTCVDWLRRRKAADDVFKEIVATDPGTLLALSRARELAVAEAPASIGAPPSPIPILLQGETGTGKELLANAIHRLWAKEKPRARFVPVQVAGITAGLINDELFGHVKGAFTDARGERPGRIEEADGGTLLIDEVGDLPLEAQLRLLRFLQDQSFARLGSNAYKKLQVRILSATWHDLDDDVAKGVFRRDLLPRLRVEQLRLPPLSERAGFFAEGLDELLRGLGHKASPLITRSARDAVAAHPWPGNLRELTSVLRSALASAHGATVRLEDLPERVHRHYLALPLHYRAPGGLEDLADAGGAPPDALMARVDALAAMVDSHPLPPESPALGAVRDFLVGIPDLSADHQASVGAVKEQIDRVRRADQARITAKFWELVLGAIADPAVRSLVERHASMSAERARELVARAEGAASDLGLSRSPWMRLASEIQDLPVFSELAPSDLFKFVVLLLRAGYSAAPSFMEEVRAIVKGGLPAVRAKMKELAQESGADEDIRPPGRPSTWTKADWKRLKTRFAAKAEAARALGIDVRTVDRCLKAHKLTW